MNSSRTLRVNFPRAHGFQAALIACLILLPMLACALDPAKSILQFNCFSWTRANGLPADNITAVVQGDDGYVWLGTRNGVLRFDGLGFKRVDFTLPAGSDYDIRAIYPAEAGGLWLAINSGTCIRLQNGRVVSVLPNSLGDGLGLACFETRSGDLWTSSEVGVQWTDRSGMSHVADAKIMNVMAFTEDPRGNVWLATAENGLWRWNGREFTQIKDDRLAGRVLRVITSGAECLWLGTGTGLLCYDFDGNPLPGPKIDNEIKTVLVDRHGTLWLGTAGEGLLRYRGGDVTSLRRSEGLADDRVTSLWEDQEGSLWVGTHAGLSQLTDIRFPIFSVAGGTARAVTPTADGGVWVGSSSGLSWLNGERIHKPEDLPQMRNRYVKLLMQSRTGHLYFVDGEKNLHLLSWDRVLHSYSNRDWPGAIGEDSESVIVAYGVPPALAREKNGVLEPFVFNGPVPEFYWPHNMCTAKDGSLWVASNNGLFRIQNGQFQQWTTPRLPTSRVYWVSEDTQGAIWAGMANGIARIRNGEATFVTAQHGLPDERVYAMMADDLGSWWVATGSGIVRIDAKSLNDCLDGKQTQLQAELFNDLDSIKSNDRTDQEPSICKDTMGRIWVPTTQGVAMINPGNFFTNALPPRIRIEDITVDGKAIDRAMSAEVFGSSRLEIAFAVLSFISPAKMQVQYQLVGFDTEWQDAGTRRSAKYNRLPPGNYRFHLRAANADGIWNRDGATFSFRVPPPFHMTWWFRTCCGLGMGLLLLAAYRWKVHQMAVRQRRLQKANESLENRVRSRTQELAYERELLRTLLDFSPDSIFFKDLEGRLVRLSRSEAQNLFAIAMSRYRRENPQGELPEHLKSIEAFHEYAIGKSDADFYEPEIALRFRQDEEQVLQSGKPLVGRVDKTILQDGRTVWHMTTKVPWRDPDGRLVGSFGTSRDITDLKEAEEHAAAANQRLVDLSREAGMAEVATGVLHNVGNVLNSINVSTSILSDRVRQSKISSVARVAELCDEQGDRLGEFVQKDPRGRHLPKFLNQLAGQLARERDEALEELANLQKNVEHVKEIVSMQQSYARVMGVTQRISIVELVEDALHLNEAGLSRRQIQVVRDYREPLPEIAVDKHKLMQIVINLIRNALQACEDTDRADKKIVVGIFCEGAEIRISVSDNGVGIPRENLVRIFSHGFTTRKDGHGFGLHSGSLAARQMGGSILVESDGPGCGAVFTLALPLIEELQETEPVS
ncbi:MAG TPA: two-component regulator propeller domain-containing protein [Verrucomicrobiae bacterium]|nr:two-component regulator propeller domain-containing protein [Verrucomicrobiae bacterium]